jgi:MYXO-CTERM domain-containing protein
VCRDDICVSSCPVCRQNCETNADCGSNAYCVDNPEGGKLCLVLCGQGSECPGDSVCYSVDDGQGGTAYVCGAPDATNSLCPQDYTCRTSDPVDECTDDSDCDPGQTCQNSVDGRFCGVADPCDGVTCDDGQVCQEGTCVDEGSANNSTGTGNNDDGGNSNGGGGGGGNNDDGSGSSGDDNVIIIIPEEDGDGSGQTGCGGCASSPVEHAPAAPILLLGLIAAGRLRRRR